MTLLLALELLFAHLEEGLSNNFMVAMDEILELHTVCRSGSAARLRRIANKWTPFVTVMRADWRSTARVLSLITEVLEQRANWRIDEGFVLTLNGTDARFLPTDYLRLQRSNLHELLFKIAEFLDLNWCFYQNEDELDDHIIHRSLAAWTEPHVGVHPAVHRMTRRQLWRRGAPRVEAELVEAELSE